jgi:DNA polymerase elongation subunit (family B)
MIIALDIETAPNADMIPHLPEPKIDSRLKDPVKIADAKAGAKQEQIEKMAIDPMTGRVICCALVGEGAEYSTIIPALTDDAERSLVKEIMETIGLDGCRIVTWNGIGFDLPYIYKRAMILGVNPANFGAPPLTHWTKRYSSDMHFDLMKIWSGWASGADGYVKLDTVAALILGERKTEIDVTQFAVMMATEDGRKKIADYCLRDTKLTFKLFERMSGTLFGA